jgi:hypothetical protein
MTDSNFPDTPTLRDEFALHAPIDFNAALRLWGDADADLVNDANRVTFMMLWAMHRYDYADAMLAQRDEPQREPGQPLPSGEDRRLDRKLVTLDFWDYRVTKPLATAGIETLRQLLALDIYQLDAIKGIGPDGLRDIIDRLNREGLRLAPKAAPAFVDDAPGIGEETIGG